ncbi:MAG: hypothetical protein H6744_09815 [Deltaproteobacteria bacterium]|nr:hypothetical protein [Deltaproteobacteria bacterium]MCB9786974.1 hypothetical protein [Deltaproteobacteria bacterium]
MRIVNIALDADIARRGLAPLLERLARELPATDEPRLIFLPPLAATLAALGPDSAGRTLAASVRRASRARPLRTGLVRLAWPRVSGDRLRWLALHDLTHRALRGAPAELARRLGATVVAGTAVLAHPRVHWEDWPDSRSLFHTAWVLDPDGEPRCVVRHPRPGWPCLEGVPADPTVAARSESLDTALGPIGVHWDDRREPDPAAGDHALVWAPRAWLRTARGETVPWEARPQRRLRGATRVLVRSCLSGRLGGPLVGRSALAVRAADGRVDVTFTGAPRDGLAWSEVEVAVQGPPLAAPQEETRAPQ